MALSKFSKWQAVTSFSKWQIAYKDRTPSNEVEDKGIMRSTAFENESRQNFSPNWLCLLQEIRCWKQNWVDAFIFVTLLNLYYNSKRACFGALSLCVRHAPSIFRMPAKIMNSRSNRLYFKTTSKCWNSINEFEWKQTWSKWNHRISSPLICK